MNKLSKTLLSSLFVLSLFSCAGEQTLVENSIPSTTEIQATKNNKLTQLVGVGEVYAKKLADEGITTTAQYLKAAAKRYDRQKLSEKTGISTKLLLDWVNYVDLMSIKGIGANFAELLESEGVDSVKELAQRNPNNLTSVLNSAYKANYKCNKEPLSLKQVTGWVSESQKGSTVEDDLIVSADFVALSDNKSNRFKLAELVGVGETYNQKLVAEGIVYTDQYLKAAAKRSDREKLSKKTGISTKLLLDWVNYVDLMSIDGIGPVYARKLEYYGIDSVKELAHRNPESIDIYFKYIYSDTCSKQIPTVSQFRTWVERAKKLNNVEE